MGPPNTPPARGSKRSYERDSEKCNCCRAKKTKCFPHDRNWESVGEKCIPCQRGGQECGPNVPFSGSPTSPHSPNSIFLLPRAPLIQHHQNILPDPPSHEIQHPVEPATNVEVTNLATLATDPAPCPVPASDVHETPTQLNPSPQCVDEKQAQQDNPSKIVTRLGHYRISLENIRALQGGSRPHIDIPEAREIDYGLSYMVWCLEKAYQDALTRLLKIASNENTISAKLIYREAAEITEAVDDDRGKFSEIRVEILHKLVSIYHNEGNLPIVESILEQICRLKGARKASCDSQVTADLAACFRATAAEMSRVFREIRLEVKPPLHLNPDVPFPSAHRALRGGHDEVTRLLCKTAEPLTDRDMLEQNALIVAAAYGKTELLEPAFRSEPSLLTDRDVLERPALFHAAHNGELESFLRLVDAGACIKDRDASSQSILRVAAAAGSTAIVHWLLTQGLSPNDDHFQISSPLHEAARRGHGDVCKLLLDHGAWANCRQHEGGKTPAGVASECGFPLISTMIEEATLRPLNDYWSQESRQAYEADQDYGHQPTSQVQAVPIPCGAIPGIGSTTPVLPIGPQAPVVPHAPGSGQLPSSSHCPGRIDDGLFPSSASDTTPDLSMWSNVGIPSSPPMAVPNVQPKDSEDVS